MCRCHETDQLTETKVTKFTIPKELYRVGFCNEKIENSSNLKKNRIFLNFDFNFEGKWGYHRQGSCQAGLGADIAEVIYRNNYTYLRDWHVCQYS